MERKAAQSWQEELASHGIANGDGLITVSSIQERLLKAPLTSMDIVVPIPVRFAGRSGWRILPVRLTNPRKIPKNRRMRRSITLKGTEHPFHLLSNHVNQLLSLLRYDRKPIETPRGRAYVSTGAVVYYFTALDNDLLEFAQNAQRNQAAPRGRKSLQNGKARAKVLIAALNDAFRTKYGVPFPISAQRLSDLIQKDSRRKKHIRLALRRELGIQEKYFLGEVDGVKERARIAANITKWNEQLTEGNKIGLAPDEVIDLANSKGGALATDWVRRVVGADLAFYEELRDRIEDPFWGHPLSKLFPRPVDNENLD